LTQVLVWWLVMLVLGWLALPTAMRIFRWLPDRGYSFARALGLLLVSFVTWIGASTGLLRNDLGGILFSILLLAGLSAWFYYRGRGTLLPDLRQFLREKWKLVLTVEVLFALALLGWALLRAYAPYKIEPSGGEKFMEIAFQNAVLQSPSFPPHDPWLSGFAISYYYFGYVMMALLTRLTGALPGVAFDLYDSLLFALTFIGSFGIVYNLVAFSRKKRHEQTGGVPREGPALATGVLGGVLVTLMGNLEAVLESLHARGILSERFWNWIDIPDLIKADVIHSWYPGEIFIWWWRASRVLADKNLFGQDIGVQPINEFPFFSFLLGDNHPHVLALPFVLLTIGLAFNLLLKLDSRRHRMMVIGSLPINVGGSMLFRWGNWLLFVFSALILFGLPNAWDLPSALALSGYTLGSYWSGGRLDRWIFQRAVVLCLGLGIYPAYVHFLTSASARRRRASCLTFSHLHGCLNTWSCSHVFLVACFLLVHLRKQSGRVRVCISPPLTGGGVFSDCIGLYLMIIS
jgi:YYY domain-containing protein